MKHHVNIRHDNGVTSTTHICNNKFSPLYLRDSRARGNRNLNEDEDHNQRRDNQKQYDHGQQGDTRLRIREDEREEVAEADQLRIEHQQQEEGQTACALSEVVQSTGEPEDVVQKSGDAEQDVVGKESAQPVRAEVTAHDREHVAQFVGTFTNEELYTMATQRTHTLTIMVRSVDSNATKTSEVHKYCASTCDESRSTKIGTEIHGGGDHVVDQVNLRDNLLLVEHSRGDAYRDIISEHNAKVVVI